MYSSEGNWGSPQVETMFQRHMRAYHEAGILQAYSATMSLARMATVAVLRTPDGDDGGYTTAAEARRSEHYFLPTVQRPTDGNNRHSVVVKIHKIDTANGSIIPATSELVAVGMRGSAFTKIIPFDTCDLNVLLDAHEEIVEQGLIATSIGGLERH